jgi:uncharacterized protein
MKRLILDKLIEWKNRTPRKPLILQGARQVGKTWILKEFASTYFERYVYLDLEEKKADYENVFLGDINPKSILTGIALIEGTEINPETDLLIIDEVQAIPRALTSLKYFKQKMPDFAVCAAGSLLGISFADDPYPVGTVEEINLYPLSFREFLINYGNKVLLDEYLNSITSKEISKVAHSKLIERLREYYVTGGLPEVVDYFINNKNESNAFNRVRKLQKDLIIQYMRDMHKHSGNENALHIESVFNNISVQLAQNLDLSVSRFKFKNVIPGKRGYLSLQGPIDWLIKAGLVYKIGVCSRAEIPFKSFSKDNIFKLYLFDVGILGAMLDLNPATILLGNYAITKGYFIENYVMTEIKSTLEIDLYSWCERNSEIELILKNNGKIFPVEVKSSIRTKAKSLQQFILKYDTNKAFTLSEKMFTSDNSAIKQNIPLYCSTYLNSFIIKQ